MKTLKTTLKLIPVLLLIAFSSCKKDNAATAGEKDGTFLKGYYIGGKYAAELNEQTLQLPYIIQFFDNAKVTINSGYISSQGNYTYKNGVLTITWDSDHKDIFNISNKAITGFNGTSKLTAYELQQTPAENQFNGNSYTGIIKAVSGDIQITLKVKFNGSQYGASSVDEPVFDTDYTLLNNAAASSNSGNNGTITFFVFTGGKLEMGSYTVVNANGQVSVVYGTFTKS